MPQPPKHIDPYSSSRPPRWLAFTVLLFALFPFQNTIFSQDIHFSQIDVNPILFVPAYSGFFDGLGRFGVSYRNQWASVSKAFQTIAATAECSLMRRRYYRDALNLGIILYSDRAGTLHYGTSAANFILSYYRATGSNNNSFFSLAIEGGIGQAGFSTSDILLEDPSEQFNSVETGFLTLGVGAAWFYQPNDDFYLKMGASWRNINRPDISYLNLEESCIEPKISFYSRAEYRFSSDIAFLPLLAFMRQKKYTELMFGGDVKWYLSQSNQQQVSLTSGVHYRWRDAAMVEFVLEYNAFLFALTYDANLSKLTPASHTFGSIELGIVYRLSTPHRVKRKAMPCPII